ncbi:GIP [Symbiodinium sp. CCMP2456]|nr:GIP [Symbiodinium sp. CCMP2456]
MFNVDAANYALSHQADWFDDFLSHDWRTSRFSKLCALLVVYNSRAALLSAFLACPLIALGRTVGVLPNDRPSSCLVYVVHLFVLCFWQRLRSILRPPIMVFLDKLCIAQSPEQAELKEKGIIGLAAFLNHSKRLVVLWSPRYFSRLWCAYEIAAFLTDHNKHKHILMMPVHAGITILLAFFFFSWMASSMLIILGLLRYGALGVQLGQDNIWTVVGGAVAWVVVPATLVGVPFSTLSVRMAKHLHRAPKQLKTFDVQSAACFCCANAHKHPDTGADIPCDRELVYRKLKEWYGRPTDTDKEYLQRFNSLVHHRLGRSVLRQMPHAVPTAPLLCMLGAASMPWLADAIERMLWRIQVDEDACDRCDLAYYLWSHVFLEWAFVATMIFLTGLLAVTLSTVAARMFPNTRHAWRIGFLVFTLFVVPGAVLTGTFFLLLWTADNAWPPTIVFVVALLLGLCFLRPTLTNHRLAGAIEELEDPSDVTPTATPQPSFSTPEADHGSMFRMPSDVSVWSDGFRI